MYNGYKSAALIIETDFLSCCKEFKEFFTEYDVPETDNEIIIEYDSDSIDEYLEPYSFFLKKNGYDMESNTIIVEGERIDAGEINFKDTRERLNRFFREHNFDQETDTFTLESDMGDTYVKTVSLDCLYPNEIIDNETSIAEYYESYIKMGELIEESFDPSIFQEGIGEAVKGGFTKVLGLLKKLLGFLKRQFLRFLNFMKGLFIKKTVSADQIMLSVNNSEFTSESYVVTESADGSEKITVTGAPGSEIKLDTIDVIIREFDIIVNSDTSSLTFVFRAGSDVAKLKHAPAPQIEGHNRIGDPGVFETAVRLVKGEAVNNHTMYTLLDTLKNLFIAIREDIDKGSSSFQFFNVAKFKKVIEDLHALLDSRYPKNSDGLSNEISVSYSDIKRGFEAVNEVYKYADDIKNVDYNSISLDGNYKGHILTFAESAAGLLSRLTMNLNKLSSVMASLWVVNGTYRKSCNSIGVAAKLASEFIKHGIPSKYVRHNIMIVLSDELNTSPPKMGQSRCVFFPKDTAIVYKIAMNGFGVLSNRAEVEITKAVKQSVVRQEFIAPIIKNWKNFAVSQERCEFKQYTASQANAILDKIKTVFADFKARNRGFKYNIMDLHDNNFARNRNGNYVIIDYGGWTHRAMGNMTGVGHVKSQLMN